MKDWDIYLTKRVTRQLKKVGIYKTAIEELMNILRKNPYETCPSFEKLKGHSDIYSRRINDQHRLVYQIIDEEHAVKIISVWGHYDDN